MRILCTSLFAACLSLQSFSFTKTGTDSVCTLPDSIIDFAVQYIGTKYVYAGSSPKGFDCSGFVYYVFKNNGVDVPRTSRDMGNSGKQVEINNCKPGDIILFRGTNAKNKTIGHAGIVIWSDGKEIEFIHSSSSKKKSGVIVSRMSDSSYYGKRLVKIVRVL
jgi:cell wall-associated NlpC family hydrolase